MGTGLVFWGLPCARLKRFQRFAETSVRRSGEP